MLIFGNKILRHFLFILILFFCGFLFSAKAVLASPKVPVTVKPDASSSALDTNGDGFLELDFSSKVDDTDPSKQVKIVYEIHVGSSDGPLLTLANNGEGDLVSAVNSSDTNTWNTSGLRVTNLTLNTVYYCNSFTVNSIGERSGANSFVLVPSPGGVTLPSIPSPDEVGLGVYYRYSDLGANETAWFGLINTTYFRYSGDRSGLSGYTVERTITGADNWQKFAETNFFSNYLSVGSVVPYIPSTLTSACASYQCFAIPDNFYKEADLKTDYTYRVKFYVNVTGVGKVYGQPVIAQVPNLAINKPDTITLANPGSNYLAEKFNYNYTFQPTIANTVAWGMTPASSRAYYISFNYLYTSNNPNDQVQYRKDSDASWTNLNEFSSSVYMLQSTASIDTAGTGSVVEPNTLYHVRARTKNRYVGYSDPNRYSDWTETTFTTKPFGITHDLVSVPKSMSEVTLSWQYDNPSFTYFEIQRGTSPDINDPSWTNATGVATSTQSCITTVTGLNPDTTYYFRIRPKTTAGSEAWVYSLNWQALPPGTDTLTATPQSCASMRLDWQDLTDKETGFTAESSVDRNNWSSFCSTSPNINYCTNAMPPSTTYYFRVKATGNDVSNNWVPDENGVSGSTPYCAPESLTITSATCSGVNLAWAQIGSGVDHYEVWRSENSGAYALLADDLPSNQSVYGDAVIAKGVKYQYKIIAQNAGLESNQTAIITPCPNIPTWREVRPK